MNWAAAPRTEGLHRDHRLFFWKKAFAAEARENGKFFLFTRLFNQHSVGAQTEEFNAVALAAFAKERRLATRRTDKGVSTRNTQQSHGRRANNWGKQFTLRYAINASLDQC